MHCDELNKRWRILFNLLLNYVIFYNFISCVLSLFELVMSKKNDHNAIFITVLKNKQNKTKKTHSHSEQ